MENPSLSFKTAFELYVYIQSKRDGRRCDETICIPKLTAKQDALNFPDCLEYFCTKANNQAVYAKNCLRS